MYNSERSQHAGVDPILLTWSISPQRISILFPTARYHHNDRPQRVQNPNRPGRCGEHVGHRR